MSTDLTEHTHKSDFLLWVLFLKNVNGLNRAHSSVRIGPMGISLKLANGRSRAHSHVRNTLLGIMLKHVAEHHRARSNVRITQMGIDLNHFKELYRAHSHVRFAPMDILLKYVKELHISSLHAIISQKGYFNQTCGWIAHLYIRIARMAILQNHYKILQRTRSQVRLSPKENICTNNFTEHDTSELFRWIQFSTMSTNLTCSHVRIAPVGIILKHFKKLRHGYHS